MTGRFIGLLNPKPRRCKLRVGESSFSDIDEQYYQQAGQGVPVEVISVDQRAMQFCPVPPLWLHQKGLYVPLALDLCQQLAIAPEKFLYLPRMSRYPIQAIRDGIEGKVVVTQLFDDAGFHKEFVEIVSTPERVFSRTAERLFARSTVCPTGAEVTNTITIDFILEKNNKPGYELSGGS